MTLLAPLPLMIKRYNPRIHGFIPWNALLAIIEVDMKFKWRKWYFWDRVKTLAERKMKDAWMDGGNCDSCCPNCKQWESKGNTIETVSNEDGSETRTCTNCGNEWKAVFTPAGFVPVDC